MRDAGSGPVRLPKFLSDTGVASRRRAEELILEGRVLVNDQIVDTLPAFVEPQRDRVIVDGVLVRVQRLDYFILHKPKNVVCTNRDPAGRLRAVDLLPDLPARLLPVGRLDAETSGLLLMTNDGELAQRITHPRYGVPKTYRAEVGGHAAPDLPRRMRDGVYLAEGKARASEVEVVHTSHERSVLMITLREGRNRQVRRMLARLGHPVRKLKRVQIGPLSLRGLPEGATRRLTPQEIAALRAAAEAAERAATTASGRPRRGAEVPARGARRRERRESWARRPAQPKRRMIT